MKPTFIQPLAAIALATLAATPFAGAIVSASGTVNDTAPSGNPDFANIGQVNGASAIYLGGGWVLTADHVAASLPASVSFGGTSYATQSGSWQRLTNSTGPAAGTNTDMVLFRLASDPGLSPLSLYSSTPTVGATVMYVGNGRVQDTTLTNWSVVSDGMGGFVWTETGGPADAAGFKTSATHEVTWGVNNVNLVNQDFDAGYGNVTTFSTMFDRGAYVYEGQAVNGDSGGAVFVYSGGHWILAGMTDVVDSFTDQPADTAVFGQSTYAVDLSKYADEINGITGISLVPEPSVVVMGLAGVGLVLRRRRAAEGFEEH